MRGLSYAAGLLLLLPLALDAQRRYPNGSEWDTTSYQALPASMVTKLMQAGRFSETKIGSVSCEWVEYHTKALVNSGNVYLATPLVDGKGGETFWDRIGSDKTKWALIADNMTEARQIEVVVHEAWHIASLPIDDPEGNETEARYAERCLQEPPPEEEDDTEDSSSSGEGEGGGGGSDDDWTDDDNNSRGEGGEEEDDDGGGGTDDDDDGCYAIMVCNMGDPGLCIVDEDFVVIIVCGDESGC